MTLIRRIVWMFASILLTMQPVLAQSGAKATDDDWLARSGLVIAIVILVIVVDAAFIAAAARKNRSRQEGG
jgi:hypothetical protein